ncbi:MAG: arsenical pump-driving ATPase [Pseudomonadota bacterium]
MFFTGKGGVGKTSIACACALALSDTGRRVLLVSTDPASNLDEMLLQTLTNQPIAIPGAPNLQAMNIDPEAAAQDYRDRVIDQMAAGSTAAEQANVREQLSGACTTEIAAFDEFVGLLAGDAHDFDHVIFDTAPTGHTLRLLSLPKAWTGFLENNDRGASCLGPHSGLKMQEARFKTALQALGDASQTNIVLVARADRGSLAEAARTSAELVDIGLSNQTVIVNGVFSSSAADDAVALAIQGQGEQALSTLPAALQTLPQDRIPLRAFDMVGLDALRALLRLVEVSPSTAIGSATMRASDLPTLGVLADELSHADQGLVMVMGKGGVGKTTVAAALAVALAARGKSVHLSTTDPAAHLMATLGEAVPNLRMDRIDPKAETQRYIDKIMASRGAGLDAAGRALLLEDLRSPCTEEVAVFHAFSRIVSEARSAFVVLDTAPTGHTLLLMDAAGAYHRQMVRDLAPAGQHVTTPLMRLQDAAYTRIVLVTLPETTPVSEAAALQEDLRRAGIEPFAWVINRSLRGSGTRDPVLGARMTLELAQIDRVAAGLARRAYLIPWRAKPPVGLHELTELAAHAVTDS